MKRINLLIILLTIVSQSLLAFNQKIDTVVVKHKSCQVLQIMVTITNTEKDALWLWFDGYDYGQDYRNAIKKFFMKRRGDFSIYDIGTDPNMVGEWWKPSAPKECFVKYLKSGSTFTIVFYNEMLTTPNYRFGKSLIKDIKI